MFGLQAVAPRLADAQHLAGLLEGALLPGHQLRLVEVVEVVHGAHEAADLAALDQVGERVAADRVLRVQHVEAPRLQAARQVGDEGGAASRHHVDDAARGDVHPHEIERTPCGPEHRLARRRRGEHRHAVAPFVQRVGQLQRVHDPAARVDGVGQQGDVQRTPGRFRHGRPPAWPVRAR